MNDLNEDFVLLGSPLNFDLEVSPLSSPQELDYLSTFQLGAQQAPLYTEQAPLFTEQQAPKQFQLTIQQKRRGNQGAPSIVKGGDNIRVDSGNGKWVYLVFHPATPNCRPQEVYLTSLDGKARVDITKDLSFRFVNEEGDCHWEGNYRLGTCGLMVFQAVYEDKDYGLLSVTSAPFKAHGSREVSLKEESLICKLLQLHDLQLVGEWCSSLANCFSLDLRLMPGFDTPESIAVQLQENLVMISIEGVQEQRINPNKETHYIVQTKEGYRRLSKINHKKRKLEDDLVVATSPISVSPETARNVTHFNSDVVADGNMYATKFICRSDVRLKYNIRELADAVNLVKQLRGTRYKWKNEDLNKNGRDTIGLIAQEVAKVIPEAVDEDDNGIKYVEYTALLPYLIEAFNTLNAQVEDLTEQMSSLSTADNHSSHSVQQNGKSSEPEDEIDQEKGKQKQILSKLRDQATSLNQSTDQSTDFEVETQITQTLHKLQEKKKEAFEQLLPRILLPKVVDGVNFAVALQWRTEDIKEKLSLKLVGTCSLRCVGRLRGTNGDSSYIIKLLTLRHPKVKGCRHQKCMKKQKNKIVQRQQKARAGQKCEKVKVYVKGKKVSATDILFGGVSVLGIDLRDPRKFSTETSIIQVDCNLQKRRLKPEKNIWLARTLALSRASFNTVAGQRFVKQIKCPNRFQFVA